MTSNSELRRMARHTLKGKWCQSILLTLILLIISGMSSIFALLPLRLENALALEIIEPFYQTFIVLPSTFVFIVIFLRLIEKPETQPVVSFFRKFTKNYGRALLGMLIVCLIFCAMAIAAMILSVVFSIIGFSIFGSEADLNSISDLTSYYGIRHIFAKPATIILLITLGIFFMLAMIPSFVYYYSITLFPYIIQQQPDIEVREAFARSKKIMRGRKWRRFLLDLSFIGWAILSMFTLGLGFLLLLPYMETSHAHFFLAAQKEYKDVNYNYTES